MSTHARIAILPGNAWLVRSADEERVRKFHYLSMIVQTTNIAC
jgi:hypothetical protein